MTADLSRLLNPRTVAVIGGGAWCASVIEQLQKLGFPGEIWPVHPAKPEIMGLRAYPGVPDLPDAPDAAFVGINRDATIGAVERLARKGAGGAVCFASGFAEVEDGDTLNARLLQAAGDMPILGPNCYGFINALDNVALWPDQHGAVPVDKGVAILTQSSNIAINLTMQSRGLPIAYVITAGNQAQLSQASAARALLEDSRVTAVGLHIEGFGDLTEWEELAQAAASMGKQLVALKAGHSDEARAATVSHTASLAGDAAASTAFLDRLGIAEVQDLPIFLEALKLAHVAGPMHSNTIATVSCSGGEASLAADLAQQHGLRFQPLTSDQTEALSDTLGPKVTLNNPLDYHTYIWRDTAAMTQVFAAACAPDTALTMLIVDFPRADRCDPKDWDCAVDAAIAAHRQTGLPLAMVATLPELMPEITATQLMKAGVVSMNGLNDALAAVAVLRRKTAEVSPTLCGAPAPGRTLTEAAAKQALAEFGVPIPRSASLAEANKLAAPLVLKGQGLAHKSEAGAVRLNLQPDDLAQAIAEIGADGYLIEEMVEDAVVELLVGVTLDATGLFLLTLGAGGVWTEIWNDTTHLILPTTPEAVRDALSKLRIAPVLEGYRGKPGVDMDQVISAILAVQDYVTAHASRLQEVEINPLICTHDAAIAADALIRIADD